jgi:hypothetical protein
MAEQGGQIEAPSPPRPRSRPEHRTITSMAFVPSGGRRPALARESNRSACALTQPFFSFHATLGLWWHNRRAPPWNQRKSGPPPSVVTSCIVPKSLLKLPPPPPPPPISAVFFSSSLSVQVQGGPSAQDRLEDGTSAGDFAGGCTTTRTRRGSNRGSGAPPGGSIAPCRRRSCRQPATRRGAMSPSSVPPAGPP